MSDRAVFKPNTTHGNYGEKSTSPNSEHSFELFEGL